MEGDSSRSTSFSSSTNCAVSTALVQLPGRNALEICRKISCALEAVSVVANSTFIEYGGFEVVFAGEAAVPFASLVVVAAEAAVTLEGEEWTEETATRWNRPPEDAWSMVRILDGSEEAGRLSMRRTRGAAEEVFMKLNRL